MVNPQLLLGRLDEIGRSLSKTPNALALIGLGSVGQELDRLDAFSDLDFFAIVKPGCQAQFLEDLSWLTNIAPVTYYFQNTRDGFKLLYEDGVFCEFAVFEEQDLATAAFSPGRIIWKVDSIDESIAIPTKTANLEPRPLDWILGEALTNLYIGLLRDERGERLTAMRFIQSHAADRALELVERIETAALAHVDPYTIERRFEQRFPMTTKIIPDFFQGYEKNRESAAAILAFLDNNFEINLGIKKAIEALCQRV